MPSSIAFEGTSANRADTAESHARAQHEAIAEEGEETSDDEPEPAAMPRDLAPLVKNLATILERGSTTADDTFDLPPRPTTPARPRSKTIAASPPRSAPKKHSTFGGKNFQFTFKMLLHKLYNADDWASKVGALLADSQARFRPLADAPPTPPPAATAFPTHNTPRRRAISQSRGGRYNEGVGLGLGRPSGQVRIAAEQENGVAGTVEPALKRRIVSRHRSVANPEAKVSASIGGWVYDAEVSARQLGPQETVRRRKRVVSSVAYSEEQKEARRVSGGSGQLPTLKRERAVQFADMRAGKRSRVAES
ncbi:hypothetical protein PENSPDRAFT_690189 [Peniophora sp. CONT]|nr:hypothetical protein PENSPDRAFT_690189 [Peniophora sp. CONT]